MQTEQKLFDFIEGLGPLLQEAMLEANAKGNHDLRKRLQNSYMASLELLSEPNFTPEPLDPCNHPD
jgi:hypothetical protein